MPTSEAVRRVRPLPPPTKPTAWPCAPCPRSSRPATCGRGPGWPSSSNMPSAPGSLAGCRAAGARWPASRAASRVVLVLVLVGPTLIGSNSGSSTVGLAASGLGGTPAAQPAVTPVAVDAQVTWVVTQGSDGTSLVTANLSSVCPTGDEPDCPPVAGVSRSLQGPADGSDLGRALADERQPGLRRGAEQHPGRHQSVPPDRPARADPRPGGLERSGQQRANVEPGPARESEPAPAPSPSHAPASPVISPSPSPVRTSPTPVPTAVPTPTPTARSGSTPPPATPPPSVAPSPSSSAPALTSPPPSEAACAVRGRDAGDREQRGPGRRRRRLQQGWPVVRLLGPAGRRQHRA